MKKVLALLLISPLTFADEYLSFNSSNYQEIVNEINKKKEQSPKKDKWMKESEFKKIYSDYISLNNSPKFYKYDFGEISIGCNFDKWTKRPIEFFCYDIEKETINLNIPFEESFIGSSYERTNNKFDLSISSRFEKNTYSGVNSDTIRKSTLDDRLILRHPKVSGDFFESIVLPHPIDKIKNNEDYYSAYLIFQMSYLDNSHKLGEYSDLKEETTSFYPNTTKTESFTFTNRILGDFIGFIIERDGDYIYNSQYENNLVSPYKVADKYLPIKTVSPVYPRRAQEKGIEGYVVVSFTVNEKGNVENVSIIEGKCGKNNDFRDCSIFNSSAVRAAEKFKYDPKSENGSPIKTYDVRHKLSFSLSE